MNPTLLSPEELVAVREQYPKALRRRDTLRLLRKLDLTLWQARQMIEGPDAVLQPLPNRSPKQWSRERILSELNNSI